MLSEISLMEKRQMLHGITYVWNLKKSWNHRNTEQELLPAVGHGGGWEHAGKWIQIFSYNMRDKMKE